MQEKEKNFKVNNDGFESSDIIHLKKERSEIALEKNIIKENLNNTSINQPDIAKSRIENKIRKKIEKYERIKPIKKEEFKKKNPTLVKNLNKYFVRAKDPEVYVGKNEILKQLNNPPWRELLSYLQLCDLEYDRNRRDNYGQKGIIYMLKYRKIPKK